jgi:hypothetical protein
LCCFAAAGAARVDDEYNYNHYDDETKIWQCGTA